MIGKKIPVTPEALELHKDNLVVDCHTHFLINGFLWKRKFHEVSKRPAVWNPLKNSLDLTSATEGGVNALAFTSYIPGWPFRRDSDRLTDRIIDRYYEIIEECDGKVAHCTTSGQIRAAAAEGKLAGFLAIEGGHVLAGNLGRVRHYYDRGVRLLTLTHFISNGIADGTTSPFRPLDGLSDFGKDVVREMEGLGMAVDVAHCSDRAVEDVLEVANKPVIYSHGALRRHKKLERNLADHQVKAIAEAGGLIGVIFFPKYLGKSGKGMRSVARQARDIAELASPRHICIGSDMDGTTYLPRGFVDASDWPQVTQALLDEGFDADEVKGILGENFLRYLDEVS